MPTVAKWVKLAWGFITAALLITLLLLVAEQLLQYKSSVINLVYLVLFVITIGKMCSTALIDDSSHEDCIFYAKLIRKYSALVLLALVIYHLIRFQLF